MRAPFSRFLVALPISAILIFSLAGIASANVISKSINTTNGECFKDPVTGIGFVTGGGPCGAAVYDPILGFTGHITFAAGEGAITLDDFICQNIKGQGGAFTAVTGTYHLALSDSGGALPGSPFTETITVATDCTDGNHQADDQVAITVPGVSGGPDYVVAYSLLLDGFDPANFANDNSILNRVEELGHNQANSASVAPPQGTPPVPEAPFTVLLIGTGAITAVWYVSRKLRNNRTLTAA
jgi:hypothetical protein